MSPVPSDLNFSLVDWIIDYEDDRLSHEEVVAGFQHLVRTGMIHSLQGHYQRTAASLVADGLITLP